MNKNNIREINNYVLKVVFSPGKLVKGALYQKCMANEEEINNKILLMNDC